MLACVGGFARHHLYLKADTRDRPQAISIAIEKAASQSVAHAGVGREPKAPGTSPSSVQSQLSPADETLSIYARSRETAAIDLISGRLRDYIAICGIALEDRAICRQEFGRLIDFHVELIVGMSAGYSPDKEVTCALHDRIRQVAEFEALELRRKQAFEAAGLGCSATSGIPGVSQDSPRE